jgi:hypothetical protein
VLITFAVFGLFGWVLWQGASAAGAWIQAAHLEPAVVQTTLAGLIGVAGILLGRASQQRGDINLRLHEKKAKEYEEFIRALFSFVGENQKLYSELPEGAPSPQPTPEMVEQIRLMGQQLLLWGSNEMIRDYGNFQRIGMVDRETAIWQLATILQQMRADLGHSRHNITDRDLLRIFINDVDLVPYNDPKGVLQKLEILAKLAQSQRGQQQIEDTKSPE